jgi:hypothetical protein
MNTPELAWFKSSYSGSSGDNCIEIALSWHKSTYSSGGDGDCVEVATCPGTVHVRDSKDKEGPQLTFSPTEWTAFLIYARHTA